MTRDGTQMLVPIRLNVTPALPRINVVLDFVEEVKQRVRGAASPNR